MTEDRLTITTIAMCLLTVALAGCIDDGDDNSEDRQPTPEQPKQAPPESVALVGCDEQFSVFTVPASQAEPYLPDGFELTGVSGEPLPEGRASLVVLTLACQRPETGEELTQFWVHLLVDPPEAYDRDDAAFQYVPVQFGVTNATFLDTLHAWGIPEATLAELDVEIERTAPGMDSWRTTVSAENGSAVVATEAAGYHPKAAGVVARTFGVEDQEVAGIVDIETTAWEGSFGAATFEDDGWVPLDVDEVGSGGLALNYEVVIRPVELPGGD